MTANPWLDRLADMGLDADVACWSVPINRRAEIIALGCGNTAWGYFGDLGDGSGTAHGWLDGNGYGGGDHQPDSGNGWGGGLGQQLSWSRAYASGRGVRTDWNIHWLFGRHSSTEGT